MLRFSGAYVRSCGKLDAQVMDLSPAETIRPASAPCRSPVARTRWRSWSYYGSISMRSRSTTWTLVTCCPRCVKALRAWRRSRLTSFVFRRTYRRGSPFMDCRRTCFFFASHVQSGITSDKLPLRWLGRYDCCYANPDVGPLFKRIYDDGFTLLIRGTKRCDIPRLPAEAGGDRRWCRTLVSVAGLVP